MRTVAFLAILCKCPLDTVTAADGGPARGPARKHASIAFWNSLRLRKWLPDDWKGSNLGSNLIDRLTNDFKLAGQRSEGFYLLKMNCDEFQFF